MKKIKFLALCLCLAVLLFSTACKSNITNTPADNSSLSHLSEQLNNAENNQSHGGQNSVNDKNPSSNPQASQGFELEEDVFDGENSTDEHPSNTPSGTLEQSDNTPSKNNQNKPSPESDTKNNQNTEDEDKNQNEDEEKKEDTEDTENTEEDEYETGKSSDGTIKLPVDWFD